MLLTSQFAGLADHSKAERVPLQGAGQCRLRAGGGTELGVAGGVDGILPLSPSDPTLCQVLPHSCVAGRAGERWIGAEPVSQQGVLGGEHESPSRDTPCPLRSETHLELLASRPWDDTFVVFLQWQETPNSPPHCSRLTGVPGALCSLLSALRGAASRGCNMRVAHHTIWDITAPGASTILRTEFHLFIVGQEALQFLAPAGLPRLLLLPGTPGAPLLQALLCPGHLSVP